MDEKEMNALAYKIIKLCDSHPATKSTTERFDEVAAELALDTPATPPKDEAKKIVNKIDEECIKTDYCGHVFVDRYEMFFILSAYADSIRKQCMRQAVNDWFLNPRIDHNETTLEAAIMRKE